MKNEKLILDIQRLQNKAEKTTNEALSDPIHDSMYKDEFIGHALSAFKLLRKCQIALMKKDRK